MVVEGKHFLGIDFGTSSSYLCVVPPEKILTPNPICIDKQPVIPTAILWEDNDEKVKAIGKTAVEEWAWAKPDERRRWRFNTQFKPEIAVSEQANKDARAFLKNIASYLKKKGNLPSAGSSDEMNVLVGVPATDSPEYEAAVKDIASAAGFGTVKPVLEPVGALIHHLMRKDISPKDVHSGLLVIDFGGGTCDVAYMLRLDVQFAWGDPLLGGRLFDDLFYQWFIEENPGSVDKLKADNRDFYFRRFECRELKERFSVTMSRDRSETFQFNHPPYGSLNDITWEVFEEKARHYCLSSGFLHELQPTGSGNNHTSTASQLLAGEEVDLPAWFEQVMGQGVKDGRVRLEDIRWVILTGGSCDWPFVPELVSKLLLLKEKHVIQSANPQGAIGEGIALLPMLQQRHRQIIRELQEEKDREIQEILDTVTVINSDFVNDLSEEIADQLFTNYIQPILEKFRDEGGTICDLKRKLEREIGVSHDEIKEFVKKRSSELNAKIVHQITDIISCWFNDKGIHHSEAMKIKAVRLGEKLSTDPNEFYGPFVTKAAAAISAIIVSTVSASICGGSGVALIITGPMGWLIGAIIGLAISGMAWWLGKEKTQSMVESVPVPRKLRELMMHPKKIVGILKDYKDRIHRNLLENAKQNIQNQETNIRQKIDEMVQGKINDLEVLDQL